VVFHFAAGDGHQEGTVDFLVGDRHFLALREGRAAGDKGDAQRQGAEDGAAHR
jgi:hypothetical protein